MNDIVKAAGRGVSTDLLNKLGAGIAKSRAQTVLPGGKPFLRLLTDGMWVYGQEDTDVEEGSHWAINPLSILHGWACWTNYPASDKRKNELLGETMAPVFDDRPAQPDNKGEWPFKEQKGFELRCLNGEDVGTEVVYKTTSVGGMRAMDGVLSDIQKQLAENPAFPCPVVEMQVDSYKHKSYGKTYVPIFTVVGWCDMEGNLMGEEAPAKALPAAEPEKQKRTRRAATPAAAAAEPTRSARQPAPEPDEGDEDDAPEEAAGSAAEPPPAARTGMPRRRPGVAR